MTVFCILPVDITVPSFRLEWVAGLVGCGCVVVGDGVSGVVVEGVGLL